ncbi:hypothetical protein NW762_001889 [Fusarium torreyae]|uniref:Uncharacterized protein n=1 Tax=Fusarium torreyae TaxID=1237075 RepID=A0A9W8VKA1_9HYPO|nr:hypothetical protein NW762_001889 [Fusarium torreyae]
MATFSVEGGDVSLGEDTGIRHFNGDPPTTADADKHMIVLYTIPHDLFDGISRGRCRQHCVNATQDKRTGELLDDMDWRPKGSCRHIDFSDDPFTEGTAVAICSNLVELALDSGPDMVLWAFSAQGWARAWALHTGREDAPNHNHTAMQADGSLRQVDSKGDYIMAEVEQAATASNMTLDSFTTLETVSTLNTDATAQISVERYCRLGTRIQGDETGNMVSVHLAEELNGIARMDVELGRGQSNENELSKTDSAMFRKNRNCIIS